MNLITKTIQMKNLQTSFRSHNELARLFTEIILFHGDELILDFKDVTFISANQFSVLGCMLSTFQKENMSTRIIFDNVSAKLENLMKTNGFGRHFSSYEPLPDIHNTTITYKIFNVSQIGEFEKYILLEIFGRNDIPKMSAMVKDSIIDNILEIFNNVKEHTNSSSLYTCGQYFPSKSLLYFTITDSGQTIPYNVLSFLKEHHMTISSSALEWAIQSGNSTRRNDSPGGLGLYLLSDFIRLNCGELYIVSGGETFEQTKRGVRYKYLDHIFPGTIVTMAFNLNDKCSYCLSNEDSSDFIF